MDDTMRRGMPEGAARHASWVQQVGRTAWKVPDQHQGPRMACGQQVRIWAAAEAAG